MYWDGAVRIDTHAPYTGEAPASPGKEMIDTPAAGDTDFSAAANPEVFNDNAYSREAYNAVYSVIHALRAGNEGATAQVRIGSQDDRWKLEQALMDFCNGYTLPLRAVTPGLYDVFVVKPDREIARAYTEDFIKEVNSLSSDREKITAINNYLCDKIIYDPDEFSDINDIASSPVPVKGSCVSFAIAMNDLCRRANVICISVHGEHHYWNAVYCDGEWSFVDASLNDQFPARNKMLFSPTCRKQITDEDGMKFLQELLVPGSTR